MAAKNVKKTTNKTSKKTNDEQNIQKISYTKQVSRKHKEKSKQRIMQAAADLFAQKGFDSTGIREICHQADANICMVSYFWGGKKALYDGIINELTDRETLYVKKNLNTEQDLKKLSKTEKIELLYSGLEKIADFLYGGWISENMYKFLLQEQQNRRIEFNSPIFDYVRKLLASIYDKKVSDKEITLKTIFILSQINSPAILPVYSLDILNRKTFQQSDINIIKNNVKLYVNALLNEG